MQGSIDVKNTREFSGVSIEFLMGAINRCLNSLIIMIGIMIDHSNRIIILYRRLRQTKINTQLAVIDSLQTQYMIDKSGGCRPIVMFLG
ncbi:hypothetical protein XAP3CFBP6996_008125 [Xanthomonas citri pv. fuscans CFBP 6996]|nr:hypothetical protein XAP3CFBP6996_008125 [Xanthomonas citri pv. fuscans CFBP 6996]